MLEEEIFEQNKTIIKALAIMIQQNEEKIKKMTEKSEKREKETIKDKTHRIQ